MDTPFGFCVLPWLIFEAFGFNSIDSNSATSLPRYRVP